MRALVLCRSFAFGAPFEIVRAANVADQAMGLSCQFGDPQEFPRRERTRLLEVAFLVFIDFGKSDRVVGAAFPLVLPGVPPSGGPV